MEILKRIRINAPRSNVWRALTTPADFGKWFEAEVDGDFLPGSRVHLVTTNEEFKGIKFHIDVEQVAPEHTFSWRWGHPEMPAEFTTLVVFRLDEVDDGTLVTVTESGLEGILLEHRSKIFDRNSEGWEIQLQNIARYVSQAG